MRIRTLAGGGRRVVAAMSQQGLELGYKYKARLGVRPFLMQSDRWIEKSDVRSGQIGHSYAVKKCLFDPNFFRSSNPIRTCRRESRLFQRDARNGLLYRVFLKPTPSLTTPRKHTITPYNSSDAGLTATVLVLLLLLLLLTTTRRGTSCSPSASSSSSSSTSTVAVKPASELL